MDPHGDGIREPRQHRARVQQLLRLQPHLRLQRGEILHRRGRPGEVSRPARDVEVDIYNILQHPLLLPAAGRDPDRPLHRRAEPGVGVPQPQPQHGHRLILPSPARAAQPRHEGGP